MTDLEQLKVFSLRDLQLLELGMVQSVSMKPDLNRKNVGEQLFRFLPDEAEF